MISDVDRIDLSSIGTHALNANNDGDQEIELNAERKYMYICVSLVIVLLCSSVYWADDVS